ncbi:amidase [Paenibacillus macerans]|uniref:Amidase n=1 Tax=Paenibacillus macerans TaxID=44252 RepID=A0A091A326_PAEMA|nr:amidase [Paenibacillus macerans]KFN10701.1 amidase family protein [Paenibacillus macerans]MBS5914079.1 amidase [Paenibacillus macerans]MCY7561734.1 amidase [Paenibacillus macerans]MDU5948223.1 amidase [Paenibacillus macerans]MEC0153125.1 amidase [Paenibacillus macerans]
MGRITIRELQTGYAGRLFTPLEITKRYLGRILLKDPALNSFITIAKERAILEAKRLEAKARAGEQTGALYGIPLAYKDNIDTKGIRTTNGSSIDAYNVPYKNAAVVQQLLLKDSILLGKNNLHEYALGVTSNNPHYGPVHNPWNREYTPGGSSGGSAAAVAADLTAASIGTDTGGSVRIPAASCGVIGLKPTYGKVPTKGVFYVSWTLDHVGPITSTMSDLAVLAGAMLGQSYLPDLKTDVRGLRIGVPTSYFNERIDPETYGLYLRALEALEALGAILIDTDVSFVAGNAETSLTIAASEAGYVHRSRMECCLSQYGEDARALLESSLEITALRYIEALKAKERYAEKFARLFRENIDVLATPTIPIPARKIGVDEVRFGPYTESVFDAMTRYTGIFNMAEVPALSIPCGLTSEGLPVGLQLVAARGREDLLIRAGYAYEQDQLGDFYRERDRVCAGYISE